jgi:TPR repeat protein
MAEDQFLEMARNLARYHREHEKFYARAPLEEAASLQRTSAALRALAERWTTVDPSKPEAASPFSGAEDLNDERAIELAGILFMEGEGEPAEITRIKRELQSASEENDEAGEWLGAAMETSWGVADALLQYPELADLLAERHRIISNDWQAASLVKLVARNLDRARAVLEKLDFSPAAVRKDLEGPRSSSAFLHSTCDLIDHASDLAAESAALVHENERRWRVFRQRIDEVIEADE